MAVEFNLVFPQPRFARVPGRLRIINHAVFRIAGQAAHIPSRPPRQNAAASGRQIQFANNRTGRLRRIIRSRRHHRRYAALRGRKITEPAQGNARNSGQTSSRRRRHRVQYPQIVPTRPHQVAAIREKEAIITARHRRRHLPVVAQYPHVKGRKNRARADMKPAVAIDRQCAHHAQMASITQHVRCLVRLPQAAR